MNLHNFSNLEPFNLNKEKKEFFFKNRINQLTLFHSKRSYLYKRFLKKFNYQLNKINSLDQVPFLPARTFKEIDLMSVCFFAEKSLKQNKELKISYLK